MRGAKATAFVGDNPIREITAGIEHPKPGFNGLAVNGYVITADEAAYGFSGFPGWDFVTLSENPDEFAQSGQRDGDEFGRSECSLG